MGALFPDIGRDFPLPDMMCLVVKDLDDGAEDQLKYHGGRMRALYFGFTKSFMG
jgi:hypothetical protein